MVDETTVVIAVSVPLILLVLAAIVTCVWVYVCCWGQSNTDIYQRQYQSIRNSTDQERTRYLPKISTASFSIAGDIEKQGRWNMNESLSPIKVQPPIRGSKQMKQFKSEPDISIQGMNNLLEGKQTRQHKLSVPVMLDTDLQLDEAMFDKKSSSDNDDGDDTLKMVIVEENRVVAEKETNKEVTDSTTYTEDLLPLIPPPIVDIETVEFSDDEIEEKELPKIDTKDPEAQGRLDVPSLGTRKLSPTMTKRRSGREENINTVHEELEKLSPGLTVTVLRDHFESPTDKEHKQSTKQTTINKQTMDVNAKKYISPLAKSSFTSPLATTSYKAEKRESISTIEPFTDSSEDEDEHVIKPLQQPKNDNTANVDEEEEYSDEVEYSDDDDDDDECELIQPPLAVTTQHVIANTGPGPKSPQKPKRKITPASGGTAGMSGPNARYKPVKSQKIDKNMTIIEEEEP